MIFNAPTQNQVMALAAVFQALELVNRVANGGVCPSARLETAIAALLNQNPSSVEELFGGPQTLDVGIDTLIQCLKEPRNNHNMTLLGYARDVFYLQKKLQGNKAMMDKVGAGISKASQQAQHFSPTHANVLANIADLYQQTISTFNRRIQVKGSPDSLQQQAIANKIRALLFAAIRCAVLWQQVGGRKTHLVFGGAKIMDIAQQLKRQL